MNQPSSRLYSHPARPEWGRGLLVAERDKLLVIHWEDGKEHLVAASHLAKLTPVDLGEPAQNALVEKLRGMQAKTTAPAARSKAKAKPSRRPAAAVMSFDAQLAVFERAFPQGFEGARFRESERGVAESGGGKPKPGGRQWAIERAAELLAATAFADAGALFDSVVTFLRPPLNLVHPMEGSIPLKAMKEETRAGFASSLNDLLHGRGDYSARFDAFIAAVQLADKDGKVKRPGWPLVTLLPALVHPKDQLFVKPQLFQKQAAILGMKINYQSAPTAAIYQQFMEVGRALDGKLRGAGQKPRDLLDVSTFVWTTLSPNSPDAPAPPPALDEEEED